MYLTNTKNKSVSRPAQRDTHGRFQAIPVVFNGASGFCRRYRNKGACEWKARGRSAGGKHRASSWVYARVFPVRDPADSTRIRRNIPGGVHHNRTKMSGTPGQKKKAYAQAFPQNA